MFIRLEGCTYHYLFTGSPEGGDKFIGSPEGGDKSSNDSKEGYECGGDWVEAEAVAEAVEWLGASVSWVDGHVAEGIRPSRCERGDDDT